MTDNENVNTGNYTPQEQPPIVEEQPPIVEEQPPIVEEQPPAPGEYSVANDDCHSELSKLLQHNIPQNVIFDFDDKPLDFSTRAKINQANDKDRLAVIHAYTANEKARVSRQKWLFIVLVVFTGVQLWYFNRIINTAVTSSFQIIQEFEQFDLLSNLFDILKFYIGATVVELIGMIATITAGTFSSSHVKTMNMLFKSKKSKSNSETE